MKKMADNDPQSDAQSAYSTLNGLKRDIQYVQGTTGVLNVFTDGVDEILANINSIVKKLVLSSKNGLSEQEIKDLLISQDDIQTQDKKVTDTKQLDKAQNEIKQQQGELEKLMGGGENVKSQADLSIKDVLRMAVTNKPIMFKAAQPPPTPADPNAPPPAEPMAPEEETKALHDVIVGISIDQIVPVVAAAQKIADKVSTAVEPLSGTPAARTDANIDPVANIQDTATNIASNSKNILAGVHEVCASLSTLVNAIKTSHMHQSLDNFVGQIQDLIEHLEADVIEPPKQQSAPTQQERPAPVPSEPAKPEELPPEALKAASRKSLRMHKGK